MGVRIIEDSDVGAVFYCSTSMWAFGPVFEDRDQAHAFLTWLPIDPRKLSDAELESKFAEFLVHQQELAEQEVNDNA